MRQKITIIIADDDEGHALLVKRNLTRIGVTNPVVHLSDGEAVLEFFANLSNDTMQLCDNFLILLDIKMPRLDGIEVLEKLKSNKKTEKIPVIMITTTDNPKEISSCHNLGCNSFINKPINYQKLTEIANSLGYSLESEKEISI
jgi:CheY-like chemotaxis protein